MVPYLLVLIVVKIILQEVKKIIPEFLSVPELGLCHTELSNVESLILPFSVCAYFYFSKFAFLTATVVKSHPAEKTEESFAPKKH